MVVLNSIILEGSGIERGEVLIVGEEECLTSPDFISDSSIKQDDLPMGRRTLGGEESFNVVAILGQLFVKIEVILEKKVTRPGIEPRTFPHLGGCSTN